jgi:hypothetical protein
MFGGAVKKPLMTKVSMRHLNEIVRERNQYSRDAMEAWQDFINLKTRMDSELTKVSKRNNFLVEELESWKQQFLKFQAFAEALTKETQDLKVKIENHKRENRRLTNLIDQQKDDAARLTVRLSGTEKQRDDALEALVLQQEIAEELERERKRNKKELAAMSHTNSTLLRQRDEAQRVVLHLRALIDGQAHHMEHIVKSLSTAPELSDYIEEGYEEDEEDEKSVQGSAEPKEGSGLGRTRTPKPVRARGSPRSFSRASTVDSTHLDGEEVTPDMEARLINSSPSRKRLSQLSMADVADRHLRDKTDAIAYIIRNISEQCAAAVEGLQLAQRADTDDDDVSTKGGKAPSESGQASTAQGSDYGDDRSDYLQPSERQSSIPPTPDLIHNRSSTSMSIASASTTPERHSLGHYKHHDAPDVPTRIVETDDDYNSIPEVEPMKYAQEVRRANTGRIGGLGPV